ncbi:MAG: hypothetical protein ABWK53_11485 [Anaerolineales bacterium]
MKFANGLKIVASLIVGLMCLYWIVRGSAQIASGNTNAFSVLTPVVLAAALAWSGWRRPLLAGILLALLGVILAMYYLLVFYYLQDALPALILMCAPMAVSGLIFIEAAWSIHKANQL